MVKEIDDRNDHGVKAKTDELEEMRVSEKRVSEIEKRLWKLMEQDNGGPRPKVCGIVSYVKTV